MADVPQAKAPGGGAQCGKTAIVKNGRNSHECRILNQTGVVVIFNVISRSLSAASLQ